MYIFGISVLYGQKFATIAYSHTHIHIHSTMRISGKHVKRLKIDAETTNASK